MAISEAQRQALVARAKQLGVSPDALIAEAEKQLSAGMDPQTKPVGAEATPSGNGEPPKIFQYHLPFMRVSEIRAAIGLTDSVPDDDMMSQEWLAKHGGGAPSQPQPSSDQQP